MPDVSGGLRPPVRTPVARRAGAWLVWWVLLMSMWVILDDSIATNELLAGAGAAALGATLAELVAHQSGLRLRIRAEWLTPVVRLPAQVARDTWIVFAALWRRVVHGVEPPSGFRAVPVQFHGSADEARTRRVVLVWLQSVAPNSLALGVDADRNIMITHQLVRPEAER